MKMHTHAKFVLTCEHFAHSVVKNEHFGGMLIGRIFAVYALGKSETKINLALYSFVFARWIIFFIAVPTMYNVYRVIRD